MKQQFKRQLVCQTAAKTHLQQIFTQSTPKLRISSISNRLIRYEQLLSAPLTPYDSKNVNQHYFSLLNTFNPNYQIFAHSQNFETSKYLQFDIIMIIITQCKNQTIKPPNRQIAPFFRFRRQNSNQVKFEPQKNSLAQLRADKRNAFGGSNFRNFSFLKFAFQRYGRNLRFGSEKSNCFSI
ncbi:hypothetical protein SS50377_25163 [Spironucleus salmonicida]|uniref:Uncharacterized protein n=1 Tax=Spironucleus salmonicida TaxID=348837 RepID=A0A9P8LRT7_9EUKA|nr:hypothetical protein SS50377_25163 [Spironucleus salmonicida]